MATPECSNHPGEAGEIIVSVLDPSVEEPTVVLCGECVGPMAAALLQSVTGRDVMEWLFPPDPPAKKATRTRSKAASAPQAEEADPTPPTDESGPTPVGWSEQQLATEDDQDAMTDEAAVASTGS